MERPRPARRRRSHRRPVCRRWRRSASSCSADPAFHDLYARRDTEPGAWYPKSATGVRKFDDLPPELAGSVNTAEVPYDRKEGETPSLIPGEIDDVVAFLETLDDGYN